MTVSEPDPQALIVAELVDIVTWVANEIPATPYHAFIRAYLDALIDSMDLEP